MMSKIPDHSDKLSVSIIIPARNAAKTLAETIISILSNSRTQSLEIIIVNDNDQQEIGNMAEVFPVKVIKGNGRGIGAARNIGVASSTGSIILFVDADCRVSENWLSSHVDAHCKHGDLVVVGGAIAMTPEASFWARCDYYSSWYNVHPKAPGGWVPNHPGGNLSVLRNTLERIGPFLENLPASGVHEDIEWESRLLKLGGRILFQPNALVWHTDRDRLRTFLSHQYRWGYNSIIIKSKNRVSRLSWVYKNPRLLILGCIPFVLTHSLYILQCWLKSGILEPLLLMPVIFVGRIAYVWGMVRGAIKHYNQASIRKIFHAS